MKTKSRLSLSHSRYARSKSKPRLQAITAVSLSIAANAVLALHGQENLFKQKLSEIDLLSPVPQHSISVFKTTQVYAAEVPQIEEPTDVEGYIRYIFGDEAENALKIAQCESGLRTTALNDKNRNGTTDHGLFQINSVHTAKRNPEFKTDWKTNVRVAKEIFDEQGWRPWVCAKAIGEENYLSN